ncbi:MAG: branched-chain amino acid transport system substrate-binding protein [Actinomycetota bacterium]|jgi:branched-chain amino acid transport system substrate-binding protein|nr:amino acid transporter substrate-binding protein [Cryptosporangiaceae bacterium]MDQ1675660.1 branched-chain amino acid transport system substrate-binding protein [Actinomycetota bacterium]
MQPAKRGLLSRATFMKSALAVGAGGVLASCGFGSSSQGSGKGKAGRKIVVGASLPMTGAAAADGLGLSRGIEMAIEEINAAGGVAGHQLESAILDAKDFAPDTMVNNFKRLVSEKSADVIVGGYQRTSGPEIDIVANAGVLYYHTNTHESDSKKVRDDPKRYWGVFQHCPTEVWYGKDLPGFLTRIEETGVWKPREHTLAVIKGNDQYTTGISAALEEVISKSGWKIVLSEQVNLPTTEWGPVLAKLRKVNADAIWLTDYLAPDEASFMKQFAQQPTQSLVHLQYGPSNPQFRELAGAAGDGVTWATTIPLLQDDIGNAFAAKFRKKYNATVSGTAATAYDAVHIYAKSVEAAGGVDDRKKIADATRSLAFRGVCGSRFFGFDADQTARPYPGYTKDSSKGMPLGYYQIQDGKSQLVDPSPFAVAKFTLPGWMKA